MDTIYQPYTYLIGWRKQQKYYYGVRYAKNCSPDDFWIKYFTSSPSVSAMRLLYGEPDIIQIRKTFLTKEDARIWENRVLKRMKVVIREDFLNKNDAPAPPINNRIMSEETKNKIGTSNRGKPKSEEHKQKIREARAKQINTRKGIAQSEETKQKLRDINKGKIASKETKEKMKQNHVGMLGKKHTNNTRQKISEANVGKILSDITKKKQSDAQKGKNKSIIQCPHCGKEDGLPQMKQWHFDNCKNKELK